MSPLEAKRPGTSEISFVRRALAGTTFEELVRWTAADAPLECRS
jgi:hypothetical protein